MSGVLHGVIASLKAAAAAATDSFFKYVTLLLNTTSTNGAQNNTFLDSSTNNFTVTRNGNTTQGTFSPFSQTGWSNYFDGTGDYLSVPRNNAFLPVANEDFTFEAWVYLTATPGAQGALIAGLGEYGVDSDWNFDVNSSLQVGFYI
ncbi:MAG TPA: LamG-like jellyroll fold domain-containing protein, partial [Phycisphaerae bacterium]|nr:LamG-like jellyroll fold domain-containing protein [Phycisphaerae bacterium]